MSNVSELVEKISGAVPGFTGYKANTFFQDDKLVRKRLLSLVDEARIRVERISAFVKQKNVSVGLRLDDLRIELLKVAQLLKRYSYTSDTNKLPSVNEELVPKILEEDAQLLTYTSRMFEKVIILSPTLEPKELLEKVNEAITLVNDIESLLRERENLILKALTATQKQG